MRILMIDYIENNVRIWDEISKKQSISSFPFDKYYIEQYICKNHAILDYGCGFGRILDYLADRGFNNLYGCDPLIECVDNSKKITPNVDILSDMRSLPYDKETFDTVISIAVLSSVIPEHERIELIRRLNYIMKEGGKIIIGDFLASDLPIYQDRYNKLSSIENNTFKTEDGAIIHHFIKEEIFDYLKPFYDIDIFDTKESKSIHQRPLKSFLVVGTKRRKNEY
jgi:SAM-dependent methyltransferase